MKKFKKILSIIFSFLILIIVIIGLIKIFQNSSKNKENSNETNSVKEIIGLNSISDVSNSINQNGENTGIYIGSKSNFNLITIKIDKSALKENQASTIIDSISSSIGYKIITSSISFEENKVKIDFSDDSAPFKIAENYIRK